MTATQVSGAAPPSARASHRSRPLGRLQAGDVVFAAGLAALLGWAAWCGRGVWFFIDEWKVITRYHNGHWLDPFNGHLSLVPIATYRALLATVGYNFAPYRAFGLACYGAVAIAIFAFARGRVDSLFAALAALLVAWSSQAQLLIMFPLLSNFTIPVAATVVIWILLERDGLATDIAATLLLALALATSSVGLIAAITVGADLVLKRETRWRRWLTFAPPVVLWLAWYFAYGQGHTGAGGTVGSVASFAARQFWATFVGLAAGWAPGGVVVLAATVAVVALAITQWDTFDRRAAVVSITLFGFLLISAIGRNAAGEKFHVPPVAPDSERYVWVDGLLIVCLVVQCLRHRRVRTLGVLAGVVLVVANGVVLARHLYDYRDGAIANARNVRTMLLAVDALGDRADPNRPLQLGFIPVPTADYLGLARHYGSPVAGLSVEDLGDEPTRVLADQWMVHDLGVRLSTGSTAPCSPGAFVVRAGDKGTSVRVRRFATAFDAPAIGDLAPNQTAELRFPADNSRIPWKVDAPGAAIRKCA
jgi:hypothetical protein